MILKKALLDADTLNGAYLSKTATSEQTIASTLKLGGKITLKTGGSAISDNENTTYLQIDPQGNHMILYDGVNNQKLSVYSSNGSKAVYLTALDTENTGLLDVAGVGSLSINTNSKKNLIVGSSLSQFNGSVKISDNNANSVDLGVSNTSNGSSAYARLYLGNDVSDQLFQIFVNSSQKTSDGGATNTTIRTMGGKLHLGAGGGRMVTLDNMNQRLGVGTESPSYKLHVTGDILADGWLRSSGGTGWYNETHGGGWHMTDTTWVRAYNGKSVYTSGEIRAGKISLEAPAGDPNPVIVSRPIPSGDPDYRNEATELLLFHANDGWNGSGPDFITLRAPSIRILTYTDPTNGSNIDWTGSTVAMRVEPDGTVKIPKKLVVPVGYDAFAT